MRGGSWRGEIKRKIVKNYDLGYNYLVIFSFEVKNKIRMSINKTLFAECYDTEGLFYHNVFFYSVIFNCIVINHSVGVIFLKYSYNTEPESELVLAMFPTFFFSQPFMTKVNRIKVCDVETPLTMSSSNPKYMQMIDVKDLQVINNHPFQ